MLGVVVEQIGTGPAEFTLHFAAHRLVVLFASSRSRYGIDRLSEVSIYFVTSRMHMGCNVMECWLSAFRLCGAQYNSLKAFLSMKCGWCNLLALTLTE